MSSIYRGVIYFAVGQKYLQEAIISAQSVRRQMPDLPLAIFSDVPAPSEIFDYCLEVAKDCSLKRQKMYALLNTPFEQTLFLDTDTYMIAPVYELFELIEDGYQFAAALSHWWAISSQNCEKSDSIAKTEVQERYLRENGVPISFANINSGLMIFNNVPETRNLFTKWDELYVSWGDRGQDQYPLRVALYHSHLRWTPLPQAYNFRLPFPNGIRGQIKILHGRHPRLDLLSKKLNYTEDFRAIIPYAFRLNTLFFGEYTIKPSPKEFLLTFFAPFVPKKIRQWRRKRWQKL